MAAADGNRHADAATNELTAEAHALLGELYGRPQTFGQVASSQESEPDQETTVAAADAWRRELSERHYANALEMAPTHTPSRRLILINNAAGDNGGSGRMALPARALRVAKRLAPAAYDDFLLGTATGFAVSMRHSHVQYVY